MQLAGDRARENFAIRPFSCAELRNVGPSLPQRELVRALVEGGPIVPRGGVVDSGTAAVDSARGVVARRRRRGGRRAARGRRAAARAAAAQGLGREAELPTQQRVLRRHPAARARDLDVRLELGGGVAAADGVARGRQRSPDGGVLRRDVGGGAAGQRRPARVRVGGHVDRALRVDRVVVVAPPARLAWACSDGEPGGRAPRNHEGRPPEAGAQVGVVEGAVGAGAQLRRAHQPARALQLGVRAPLWVPRAAGAAARRALPHGGRDPLGAARAAHQPRRPLRPPAPLPPRRARRRRRRQRVRARPLQRRAPCARPARVPRARLRLRRDRARRDDRAEGAAAAAAQGGRADRRAGFTRLHAAAAAAEAAAVAAVRLAPRGGVWDPGDESDPHRVLAAALPDAAGARRQGGRADGGAGGRVHDWSRGADGAPHRHPLDPSDEAAAVRRRLRRGPHAQAVDARRRVRRRRRLDVRDADRRRALLGRGDEHLLLGGQPVEVLLRRDLRGGDVPADGRQRIGHRRAEQYQVPHATRTVEGARPTPPPPPHPAPPPSSTGTSTGTRTSTGSMASSRWSV